jgi:hypothetical protein
VDLRRPPERLEGAFDVVLDAANALPFRHGRRLLRPGGTQVSVNPIAARLSPDVLARLRGGRRLRSVLVQPRAADLEQLSDWLQDGTVRPVLTSALPLAQVQDAAPGGRARPRTRQGRAGRGPGPRRARPRAARGAPRVSPPAGPRRRAGAALQDLRSATAERCRASA